MGFLEKIAGEVAEELSQKLGRRKSLISAIEGADGVPVIAEIKWSSPSAGRIREPSSPVEIGKAMVRGGAVGISVLAERRFFMGEPQVIAELRKEIDVPILYKGFIVHLYQLFEASTVGSDAVLLIARLLGDRLRYFMKLAEDLGMESLVEVFSPEDVRQALNAGARLVGINNRDLETLEVDVSRTERLAGLIPDDVTLVSESGISTVEDVRRVMAAGADAVLVGTSIMRVANVEEKVRELVGALR
jgi:indole-3-glycerol phosphate synthase